MAKIRKQILRSDEIGRVQGGMAVDKKRNSDKPRLRKDVKCKGNSTWCVHFKKNSLVLYPHVENSYIFCSSHFSLGYIPKKNKNAPKCYCLFHDYFSVYLFILRETETASRGGAKREGERILEPDAGLELVNREIMT